MPMQPPQVQPLPFWYSESHLAEGDDLGHFLEAAVSSSWKRGVSYVGMSQRSINRGSVKVWPWKFRRKMHTVKPSSDKDDNGASKIRQT